jgi:hypothetical protein
MVSQKKLTIQGVGFGVQRFGGDNRYEMPPPAATASIDAAQRATALRDFGIICAAVHKWRPKTN